MEAVAASGHYVASLANRPDKGLPPELVYLLRQFIVLHGHRPAGFGLSPIPLTEIEAYWRIYLKDDDVLPLHVFTDWIMQLDDVVMEYETKKQEPPKEEKPKP